MEVRIDLSPLLPWLTVETDPVQVADNDAGFSDPELVFDFGEAQTVLDVLQGILSDATGEAEQFRKDKPGGKA